MTDENVDTRWNDGMNGWRVEVTDPPGTRIELGAQGEVTGYSHGGCFIWVVLDGDVEPTQLRWSEVRPA